ncbi:Retrovirus-related Pol polyprotein from transposon gypsy [Thelohanellus kitauei]|uniref:Retrovirus-related Pol polyprotein from transposon gypsy n=1 Tax=Thelohanellus kitauei TaxID=669202 RepID=A0A0C2J714_THEKT|nr:Retrovirus-related Pol polyprotein from transposon gypsy [Thelohanellus kitauei]
MLDILVGSKYITTLDIDNAYWRIPIEKLDKQKTAFSHGQTYGIYEFKFYLTVYQTLQHSAQKDEANALASVDDIVIFSKSLGDHLIHIRNVLKIIAESGFKLSRTKCNCAKTNIRFLAYVIGPDGVEVDPKRID